MSEGNCSVEALNNAEPALNKVTVLKVHSPQNEVSREQTFYIVGTAHISKASCEKVKQVVQAVKPEAVFLELCDYRRALLQHVEKIQVPTLNEMLANVRNGNATLFESLYSWMLGKFGSEMEVVPGEEFRVAYREAQAIGAKVVLGDRPVPITVARMWAGLSFFQKMKLCWHLLITGINLPSPEEMNKLFDEWLETDALTEAIKELSQTFPSMAQHLINERDRYMVYTMRQVAGMASTVVAVVGAGHLPGIKENWEKEIDIKEIASMPPKQPSRKWQYAAIIVGGIATVSVVAMRVRAFR